MKPFPAKRPRRFVVTVEQTSTRTYEVHAHTAEEAEARARRGDAGHPVDIAYGPIVFNVEPVRR